MNTVNQSSKEILSQLHSVPVSGTLRYSLNQRAIASVRGGSFDLEQLLSGVATVAIGGHTNPDGDCVGSCMGLYLYLLKNYPKIEVDVYLEEIPPAFHLLSHTEDIKHTIRTDKQYDLFICLDCGDLNRLGFSISLFERAKKTLCIDHHISNQGFADLNYIVTSASSTSEMVFYLFEKQRIPPESATALYLGIIHDTGVFQYSSTSPDTMRVAAELLAMGVNGYQVVDETYYSKSYIQNRVLGKVLAGSQLVLENRGIISILSKQEREALEATIHDLDGIVSVLRTTKGVNVAIFVYEVEPHQYKVSLRSTEAIDVRLVAEAFGGGGHQRAAGVAMVGSVEEIKEKLIGEIRKQISKQIDKG